MENYIPVAQFEGDMTSISGFTHATIHASVEPGLGPCSSIYFECEDNVFGFIEHLPESPTPHLLALYLGGKISFKVGLVSEVVSGLGCSPKNISWLSNNVVI